MYICHLLLEVSDDNHTNFSTPNRIDQLQHLPKHMKIFSITSQMFGTISKFDCQFRSIHLLHVRLPPQLSHTDRNQQNFDNKHRNGIKVDSDDFNK